MMTLESIYHQLCTDSQSHHRGRRSLPSPNRSLWECHHIAYPREYVPLYPAVGGWLWREERESRGGEEERESRSGKEADERKREKDGRGRKVKEGRGRCGEGRREKRVRGAKVKESKIEKRQSRGQFVFDSCLQPNQRYRALKFYHVLQHHACILRY